MSAITGGLLLDREVWGWAAGIDLDTLDMGDPARCILGQLCPDRILARHSLLGSDHMRYAAMAEHLSGLPGTKRERWSHKHGFLAAGSGYPVVSLTRDWVTQVKMRLVAA